MNSLFQELSSLLHDGEYTISDGAMGAELMSLLWQCAAVAGALEDYHRRPINDRHQELMVEVSVLRSQADVLFLELLKYRSKGIER